MSVVVDKNYIINVPYASNLKPVSTDKFFTAAEEAFTLENVRQGMKWVFADHSKQKYAKGMEAFQKSMYDTIGTDKPISVDAQKYLVDIFQRAAYGKLPVTVETTPLKKSQVTVTNTTTNSRIIN